MRDQSANAPANSFGRWSDLFGGYGGHENEKKECLTFIFDKLFKIGGKLVNPNVLLENGVSKDSCKYQNNETPDLLQSALLFSHEDGMSGVGFGFDTWTEDHRLFCFAAYTPHDTDGNLSMWQTHGIDESNAGPGIVDGMRGVRAQEGAQSPTSFCGALAAAAAVLQRFGNTMINKI